MATKIKISDFRKEYDGLDWARNWNQGGTQAENFRCNLALQLVSRIVRIREMLPLVPVRFSVDRDNANRSLERAERAILKNQLGRAVLFRILGSQEIPCGQYPEAQRVNVSGIWAFVAALDPSEVSQILAGQDHPECGVRRLQSWILPDPDAKSNCLPFPGK